MLIKDGLALKLVLLQGRDDLRQDAVMQQVFEMVNNLLQKDSEARKRKLHIRKYKVHTQLLFLYMYT